MEDDASCSLLGSSFPEKAPSWTMSWAVVELNLDLCAMLSCFGGRCEGWEFREGRTPATVAVSPPTSTPRRPPRISLYLQHRRHGLVPSPRGALVPPASTLAVAPRALFAFRPTFGACPLLWCSLPAVDVPAPQPTGALASPVLLQATGGVGGLRHRGGGGRLEDSWSDRRRSHTVASSPFGLPGRHLRWTRLQGLQVPQVRLLEPLV